MAKNGRDQGRDEDDRTKADKAKPARKALRQPTRRRAAKETAALAGLVADVFGRRFTLEADGARTLVDLGRRGAALVTVAPGARLLVTGRRKNGELKAWALRDEADGRTRVLRKEKRVRKLAAASEGTGDAAAATNAEKGA